MKQLFNYKKYQEDLEKFVVRKGEDRTYTPVDFITDEELKELSEKGINNLTDFVDSKIKIDNFIKKHIDFTIKLSTKLSSQYPNDDFLKKLADNGEVLTSYNWYEKYGYKFKY